MPRSGPAGIMTAFNLLKQGKTLDVNGASGPLNFNLNNGDAPSNIDIWCIGVDSMTGNAKFSDSSRFYNAGTSGMVGLYAQCP